MQNNSSFGVSDVAIVVVTGRSNPGGVNNPCPSLSYQNYSSTRYSLHRAFVCNGPRPSIVLQALFGSSTVAGQQARLEIDMLEEEANAFPRLVDYIYRGTPIPKDDIALTNLTQRFQVIPRSTSCPTLVPWQSCRTNAPLCFPSEAPSPAASSPAPPASKPSRGIHSLLQGMRSKNLSKRKSKKKALKPSFAEHAVGNFQDMSDLPREIQSTCNAKKGWPRMLQVNPVHTLENFQDIPNLLKGMRSDCDVAKKRRLQKSLRNLLTVPQGQEEDVASFVASAGSIPYLLEIISGFQYATLHLATIELLAVVANESIGRARHLEKSFVVETMLECQLFHGLEVRSRALGVISAIAAHSENLCSQVLKRRGCLKSVLVAYKRSETKHVALLLLFQFCNLCPQQVLRKDVLKALSSEISAFSPDQDILQAAISSLVNLADAAFSDCDDIFHDAVYSLSSLLSYEEIGGSRSQKSRRAKHALGVLTHLAHKPFLIKHILWGDSRRTGLSQLLWSPCKEMQLLACNLVAALAKSLRENEVEDTMRIRTWCNADVIPPLTKLLAYEGATQVSATVACTELVRCSNSIARAFVEAHGIPPICHALYDKPITTDADNQEKVKMSIFLAFQCLLEIEDGTQQSVFEIENGVVAVIGASDILHTIGTNLAQVMLGCQA